MKNDKIAKTVYVGVCAGSCSAGRPRKRRIDTTKYYLNKRGLDVRQAWRMGHYISEWWKFASGNTWGVAWRMNP